MRVFIGTWRCNLYRLFIEDENEFKRFLAITDSEYIDVLLNSGVSRLINDSNEIFGCMSVETNCGVSDTGMHCRLPRKDLLSLSFSGVIDITEVENSKLQIDFRLRDDTLVYSVIITSQDIFADGYSKKLDTITRLSNKIDFDCIDIGIINRISKSSNSIISCTNGVIGSRLRDNCRIYKKTDMDVSFSATARSISVLRSFSDELFSLEGYIGVVSGNVILLATKTRDNINDDFDLIKEEKSKFICTVDFSSVIGFMTKVKPDVDYVEIELEQQLCVIERGRAVYRIPVKVSELIKSEKAVLNSIRIPKSVILYALNVFGSGVWQVAQRRYFFTLEKEGTLLVI